MSPLVLVLDQGGHSSRALVFADDGAIVAQASQPVGIHTVQPGRVEQNPQEILASLTQVLAAIAAQLGERCSALCSAALIVQRASVVAWDRSTLQVLSPVLSWQDTRHAAWLDNLVATRRDHLRAVTGLYANAHYGASKFRWLLDNEPAVQTAMGRGTLCMAPLASYLQQQLTAAPEPWVDAVIASRTLLTELGFLAWSTDLLELFSIPATVLPQIRPTLADYGMLRVGEVRVPLQLLGGDQSFFALSHAAQFAADTVFINAGTGAFVQQVMPASYVPSRLLCSPLLIDREQSRSVMVAEGTVNAAASALDWFWQHHGVNFTAADWQAAAQQARNEPHKLPLFCNRVTASGSPDWLPAGESFFSFDAPLSLQAIAVLESIVFALQRNLDCLSAVQPSRKIVLSGGLAQLDVFCTALADLAQLPLLRSADVEACARGAAMQLMPGSAGQPVYREFLPQANTALQQRYTQWTALMDQLVRTV